MELCKKIKKKNNSFPKYIGIFFFSFSSSRLYLLLKNRKDIVTINNRKSQTYEETIQKYIAATYNFAIPKEKFTFLGNYGISPLYAIQIDDISCIKNGILSDHCYDSLSWTSFFLLPNLDISIIQNNFTFPKMEVDKTHPISFTYLYDKIKPLLTHWDNPSEKKSIEI